MHFEFVKKAGNSFSESKISPSSRFKKMQKGGGGGGGGIF